MKKVMALLLAAMFALSLIVPAMAVDLATFSLTAAYDEDYEKVAVTVVIDSVPDGGFTSYSWRLIYDSSAFSIGTSLSTRNKNFKDNYQDDDGACITLTSKNSRTAGLINFNCVTNSAEPFEYTGKVCTFWFDIKDEAANGEYTFTLKADPKSNANVVDVASTTYTIGTAGPTIDDFTAGMSATVSSTDATANLVIGIPEGADLSKLSVTVDGVAATLPAAVNDQIKLPTAKKAARNLAEQITYTITYDGASKTITTSLADYAAALAASEDAATAAVGQAMLNYGAAARAEFDKTGDAPEIVGGVADGAPAIVFDKFDATALNAALRAPESTVSYTALTATYETEITLSMALRINDNFKSNPDAAAQWVADNFKIDGKDVAVSTKVGGSYTFIIITVAGISVDDVKTPMAITVAGADAGTVCVANYLASVEAAYATNPAKAGQLNVARALFAYATALEAIA